MELINSIQLTLSTNLEKSMVDNPYLDAILTSIGAVIFIIISSYGVGVFARFIARLTGASPKKQENAFAGYLFASPWIVGFLIFVIIPMGFSLYWSFTDYRVVSYAPANWVGFDNYTQLILKDGGFRASIINTLYLTVIGLPLQMGFALFLAVMLSQNMRGERIFRIHGECSSRCL